MDESKVKVRKKSKFPSFPFTVPKITFTRSSVAPTPTMEIGGVIPGTFSKEIEIKVDEEGKVDLDSVPDHFKEKVQKLFDNMVNKQKFINADDHEGEEGGDGTPAVVRRKGPRVEKGMKEEEIISEMQGLVIMEDPWKIYRWVRMELACSVASSHLS